MSRWVRFYADAMRNPKVMRLSDKDYRKEMVNLVDGKPSVFNEFVTGPYERPFAHEWTAMRARIFERDDYTCTYCGSRGVKLECDHIEPVSKGGSSLDDNLTTACKPCNRSKAGKSLSDWKRA